MSMGDPGPSQSYSSSYDTDTQSVWEVNYQSNGFAFLNKSLIKFDTGSDAFLHYCTCENTGLGIYGGSQAWRTYNSFGLIFIFKFL